MVIVGILSSAGATRASARPQAAAATPGAAESRTDDFGLILQRLKAQFTDSDYSHAEGWLSSLAADGHWPDLQIEDRAKAGWNNAYLSRLAQMAAAYATPASPDYHSPKMLEGASRGLQYWLRERQPLPGQWWQNTIGQPLLLAHTLVPLGDVLPPDLLHQGLGRFAAPAETGPEVRGRLRLHYPTAEDLVWFAQQQLIRGTLSHSAEDVAEASNSIQEVILVSTNDGIQPDFTYHVHGSELYNGGYGHDFILDTCKYATISEELASLLLTKSSRYLPTTC